MMAIQMPRHDSLAAFTTARSLRVVTKPTEPGRGSHPSTTPSSVTFQPTPTTSGSGPGPADNIQSGISQRRGCWHGLWRGLWRWIPRNPIAATLCGIIFLVFAVIVVMVLTLNGDVQSLYGSIPSNETGVSPSSATYGLSLSRQTH